MLLEDVQEITDGFTNAVNKVALTNLGKVCCAVKPHASGELVEKCDHRRKQKAKKSASDHDNLRYKEADKELRKEIQSGKEEWIQDHCDRIRPVLKPVIRVKNSRASKN